MSQSAQLGESLAQSQVEILTAAVFSIAYEGAVLERSLHGWFCPMIADMEQSTFHNAGGAAERIAPRYEFEGRIRICVERSPQNLVMDGWARDISETGLCAFVAHGLILREDVTLEIRLSPAEKLTIPARVVRSLGTQYGFQFRALSADQRAEILSTVKGRREVPFLRTQ